MRKNIITFLIFSFIIVFTCISNYHIAYAVGIYGDFTENFDFDTSSERNAIADTDDTDNKVYNTYMFDIEGSSFKITAHYDGVGVSLFDSYNFSTSSNCLEIQSGHYFANHETIHTEKVTIERADKNPWVLDTIIASKGNGENVTFEASLNDTTVATLVCNSYNQTLDFGSIMLDTLIITSKDFNQFYIDSITGTTSPYPEINVKGNGQDIPSGDTQTSVTNNTYFGTAVIGGSPIVKTFTIENTGDDSLVLTGGDPYVFISTTGDYSIMGNIPPSQFIYPGSNTSFEIDFYPREAGLREATVEIFSSAKDNYRYTFKIQGTGEYPTLSISDSVITETDTSTSATFNVTLSEQSSETVTVEYTTANNTAKAGEDYTTIATQTLTFLPNETSKDITVEITGDTTYEDTESFYINLSNANNATIAKSQGECTISDNDPLPLVRLQVDKTQLTENPDNCKITVTKHGETTQDITVNLGVSGTATGTEYSLLDNQLTILANETEKSTTITSIQDTLDEDDETIIIDITSAVKASEDGTQQQTITILDDDDPPTVSLTLENSPLAENGGQATLKATLSEVSGKDITVNLAYSGVAANEDYTAPPTISVVAGQMQNSITLTGINDNIAEDNESISIDITSVVNGTENGEQVVTASITDDDTADITLNESGGDSTISENGSPDSFTVAIDTKPQDKVVIEISSSDTGEVTVSPATLTFTKDNYSSKTVILTGVDDSLIDGDVISNITIAVKNDASDSQYHNLSKIVTVTTISDDTAGFTITQTDGSTIVSEDGTEDTFEVVLNAQPDSNVVIDISNPNTAELILDKDSLTFDSGNWDTAHTVTVTGVDDSIKDGNISTDITVSINDDSSDNAFDPVANQIVTVTTLDNDEPNLIIIEDGGSTSVTEGLTANDEIIIKLATQPSGGNDVNITLTPTDSSEVALSNNSITIENANWNVGKTVTITSVDDSDLDGDIESKIEIISTSSDSDYHNLTREVNVVSKDNEFVSMSVTGNSNAINNGGTPNLINHTDFGEVDIHTGSVTRVFTIHNSGNYILIVNSFDCYGNGFSIKTGASDTFPESETIFEIMFDPSTVGAHETTVTIGNNDVSNNPYIFTIKGTGTEDTIPPTATAYSPANGATSVSTNTNLEMTFSENIVKGTGNITLKKYSDDSIVEIIPVSNVVVENNTASVTLTNPLQKSTKYYVQIDSTCFEDSSSNAYTGISNKDTWSFTAIKPSSSGSGSSSTWISVEVNGEVQPSIAKSQTKYKNGKRVTTVTIDEEKLQKRLEQEKKPVISIPVNNKTTKVEGRLNGKIVKVMEQKEAVVEIKTQKASYTIPADQISIDEVSQQLGEDLELEDIEVDIEIGETPEEMIEVVENTANKDEYTLVVPPVDFTVKCSYKNKTVEVKKYHRYVERTIAIPEGADSSKITTGVVVYPDGTSCHVPTKIIIIDGKYYAKINSLSNSTYSVIYNPQQYEDVKGHWAEDICNEMASRMIVAPATDSEFEPNQEITRLYFTKTIVKALGLGDKGTASKFSDINQADDYFGFVATALEYNLISGYAVDNTLRPHNKITREEAAALIVRTMNLAGLNTVITEQEIEQELTEFADKEQIGSWAKRVMALCVKNTLLKGDEKGQLSPKSYITKAELATILYRLLTEADLI